MELSIFKNVKGPETINLRHATLGEQPEPLRGGTDKMGKGSRADRMGHSQASLGSIPALSSSQFVTSSKELLCFRFLVYKMRPTHEPQENHW